MKKQADVHVRYDKEVRHRGKGGTSPWPVFFVSEEGRVRGGKREGERERS
jgi:hypothetical protein